MHHLLSPFDSKGILNTPDMFVNKKIAKKHLFPKGLRAYGGFLKSEILVVIITPLTFILSPKGGEEGRLGPKFSLQMPCQTAGKTTRCSRG
jgi:hypothetical protein